MVPVRPARSAPHSGFWLLASDFSVCGHAALCVLAQAPRPAAEGRKVVIDAAEPVTKSCLECHLEMHGQPLETAGQGRVAGECLGCHQGLHAQPVRSFVFEGKITFRRALDGFEPGREYEGRPKLKPGNIYLYPERHPRINPGRLTGLRSSWRRGAITCYGVRGARPEAGSGRGRIP